MNQPGADVPQIGRWRFGVFDFDARTLELTKNGRLVAVRPQPLKILALLLARPGELVSRNDLQRTVWSGDTFVDFEQGLNHAIRELRAALGDGAESPLFIQTLPRRGYRFIAPVEAVPPSSAATPSTTVDEAPDLPVAPTALPDPFPAQRVSRIRWVLAAAGTVALATAISGMAYVGLRRGTDGSGAVQRVLAVRPFSVPSDPALGIGLADTIVARLAGQQAALVRFEPAAAATGGLSGDSDESTWPAGATHTLDGDVSISGAQVDVLVRLRDHSRRAVWSERIQVRSDELFDVEAVVTERVVSALRLQLAATEQARLRQRYTGDAAAYADYLRGRARLVTYTREGALAAVEAFEEALRRDPAYTLARAGLAMASADMYLRFAAPADLERWGQRAEEEARAALDLDSDLAEAHLARAAVARKREFDWNATVTAARRALALNPNLDQARFFVAAAYYHNGFMQEALIEMEKGRGLHGADVVEPIRIEALTALFSGKFAPAQARLEEVSRLSSQAIGDTYLALAYYYTGSADRARAMLAALADSRSASTAARAGAALAGVLAADGDSSSARAAVDRVLHQTYRDHHVAYSLGAAYSQLGDFTLANRWLRTAADTGFPCVTFFEHDPLLEPLRLRADFPDLLRYVRIRRDAALPLVNP